MSVVAKQPDPLYKNPSTLVDLVLGLLIGTIFCTLLLVDFSVITLDNAIFTAQYYIWKSQAAYVRVLVIALSCTLPLALIGIYINTVHMFTRKATLARNIYDILQGVVLIANVFISAVIIAPAEERIISAALAKDLDQVSFAAITILHPNIIIALIVQFIALILPIMKHVEGVNNPIPMVDVPVAKKND